MAAARSGTVDGSTCGSIFFLLATMVALGGCALIDPYPQPKPLVKGQTPAQEFAALCRDSSQSTAKSDAENLCDAFGYAESWRLAYYSAARQHSIARNSAALITVPLAAVGVFEGLRENGNSDRIARVAVEAVGIYSLANLLTSTPRQKVYLSGAKAMVCAMFEARPLLVGIAYSEELRTSVEAVKTAANALATTTAGVDLSEPSHEPVVVVQTEATNAIAKARRVAGELRVAGMTLRNRVDFIAMQVAELVPDTEPSPESLNSLFNNFGGMAASFQQGLSAAKPKSGALQAGLDSTVKQQIATLRARIADLNGVLNAIGETAAAVDRIGQCKPEGADSGFKVTPEDPGVIVQAGKTFEFTIANKVAFPVARLEGSNAAAVELGPITVKDRQNFGVSIKGVTATGENGPTLVLTDGTGSRSKSIQIIVTGETQEKAAGAGGSTDTAAGDAKSSSAEDAAARRPLSTDEEQRLSDAQVSMKSLQCYVGVEQDGTIGKNTRAAIAAKRTSTPDPPAPKDEVDGAFMTELAQALAETHTQCKGL